VRNVQNTKSRALPEGVIFTDVFRYIGTEPPESIRDYELIGVAKRGMFNSRLDKLTFDRKKYYAWYVAAYKSKKGKRGLPSEAIRVQIID
jgi:hypothetical protein